MVLAWKATKSCLSQVKLLKESTVGSEGGVGAGGSGGVTCGQHRRAIRLVAVSRVTVDGRVSGGVIIAGVPPRDKILRVVLAVCALNQPLSKALCMCVKSQYNKRTAWHRHGMQQPMYKYIYKFLMQIYLAKVDATILKRVAVIMFGELVLTDRALQCETHSGL